MPVKIRSMQTNPNGSVVVSLSFPDSELDKFLAWYSSNGRKQAGARRGKRSGVRRKRTKS